MTTDEIPATTLMEERFRLALADWRAKVAPPVELEARYQAMRGEVDDLVRRGLWTSGPSDLLTLIGRHGDELLHSRLLGWLLNPAARHGLGDAFLARWLRALWPEAEFVGLDLVTADTEVTTSGVSGVTGEALASRADLVVYGDGFTVVVENKVGAGEQPRQCERLYWSWVGTAQDVRWVFLTPRGVRPTSAGREEVLAAWTSMSYRQVRDVLAATLAEAEGPTHLARTSALQYLATLDAHSTFSGR